MKPVKRVGKTRQMNINRRMRIKDGEQDGKTACWMVVALPLVASENAGKRKH